MNLTHDRKWTTLLFNPFAYIAGAQAFGLGLTAILVAGLVGFISHTHFDGVLDTHTGRQASLGLFLAEGLVDWLCLTVVLLIFGKLISRTSFRLVDLFGTQALARWPTLFTSLITLPPAFQRFNLELLAVVSTPGSMPNFASPDAAVFLAVALAMLPLTCWMVLLMYNSYSVSCNVRGGKAIGTFILGMILAEILSKMIIYRLI